MRMTLKRSAGCVGLGSAQPGWVSSTAMLAVVAGLVCCGCGAKEEEVNQSVSDQAYKITLDRGDNGSAVASQRGGRTDRSAGPRDLTFEMAGFSRLAESSDAQEQRAAALQAAIIDAFSKALIEARRSRGQSDADFIARLGPRLTVTHCSTGDGYEVQVELIARGAETTFVIRNGQMQHPPRDLQAIHRIFEETNGEFSLLGTEWSPEADVCVATVGCYLPARFEEALAGNVAVDADDESGVR